MKTLLDRVQHRDQTRTPTHITHTESLTCARCRRGPLCDHNTTVLKYEITFRIQLILDNSNAFVHTLTPLHLTTSGEAAWGYPSRHHPRHLSQAGCRLYHVCVGGCVGACVFACAWVRVCVRAPVDVNVHVRALFNSNVRACVCLLAPPASLHPPPTLYTLPTISTISNRSGL